MPAGGSGHGDTRVSSAWSSMSDAYDSPWKGALDAYFQDFLALLFPEAHEGIDWEKDYKSLDSELQKLARDNRLGGRSVDKLVEVSRRGGEKSLILVHVEVQSQRDLRFEQRMWVYHYRIYDRYERQVVSLAVLADLRPTWRPNGFGYAQWGCRLQLDFPVAKLLARTSAVETCPGKGAIQEGTRPGGHHQAIRLCRPTDGPSRGIGHTI